jgi:hypothetical protein
MFSRERREQVNLERTLSPTEELARCSVLSFWAIKEHELINVNSEFFGTASM